MATRATPKRKPAPAPIDAPIPQESADEPEWASRELLSSKAMFEDVVLLRLGKKVRVRYLDTVEITTLQLLPDYAGYLNLVLRLQGLQNDEEPVVPEDFDAQQAGLDTVKYQVHVAHRAIVDHLHPGKVKCEDCGDFHPRSLWSLEEARRLPSTDLDQVAAIAVRAGAVMAQRPFSKDEMQPDSSPPADSGESTPPTNS